MNKTLCVIAVTAGIGIAFAKSDPDTKKTPKPAAKSAASSTVTPSVKKKARPAPHPVEPLKIPSGAVKTAEGNYRFIDPQGKVWLYRETPFGVSRALETPALAASASPAPGAPAKDPNEHVTAVADGDTIRFQKPSPFGVTSWQKNKADLTPEEQKVWEREQAKRNQ
jgi:hypothetical protein